MQDAFEKIQQINQNIIISSAAGNSGPWRGSIQFPSTIQSILSIGTVDPLSSRGPSLEIQNYPIKKPDFIIDINQLSKNEEKMNQGSSIACAQFTGYISKYSKNGFQKNLLLLTLIKSSYSFDNYSIYDQGYGVLDLKQQISINQFSRFVEVFPSLIDLTGSSSYYDFIKYFDIQDQDLNTERYRITIQIINVFQKNIFIKNVKMLHKQDNNKVCPFSVLLFDQFINFKKSWIYAKFDLFQKESGNLRSSEVVTCILILDFQIQEIFTSKIILESEIVKINIKGKIVLKKDITYNILLNSYYHQQQLQNLFQQSNFKQYYYVNQFDYFGKNLLTNYNALKLHYQQFNHQTPQYYINFLETQYEYSDLTSLSNTLLILVDLEIPLTTKDIKYIQNHVKERSNSLIIFGEWFTDFNQDQKAFDYLSINELLLVYGLRFYPGSFSQKICDSSYQECIVYYSGCQIEIFEKSELIKNITYKKYVFENDFNINEEQEFIYYVEIITNYDSNIFLFGDSACLEDAFQYQNCFHLIDKIVQLSYLNK